MVTRDSGDRRGALPLYEAALALRRELGDGRGVAQTLQSLGNLAVMEGNTPVAIARSEESLATARALGDRHRVATSLHTLAYLAQRMGDSVLARRRLETQLEEAQDPDDARWTAVAAYRLAALAAGRGEAPVAAQLYLLSLRRCVQRASREGTLRCLVGLASLALAGGQVERAARLLGAAAGVREAPGNFVESLWLWTLASDPTSGSEEALRRALAAHPQAPTWLEVGRLLPLAQAVAEAEAVAGAVAEDGGSDGVGNGSVGLARPSAADAPSAGGPEPLTPREREVAVLVARGATNRQIAARLVIAERTAMRHVEHIFTKLGVHSRAEVGAWAARHGLDGPAGSA
jgi:non-specific serine/threonine protein kinase